MAHLTFIVVLAACSISSSMGTPASVNDLIPLDPASRSTGRSTYWLSKDTLKKDWYGASSYCVSAGMKLVSIESASEDNQLLGLLSGVDQAWTSGNDLAVQNDWYWGGTGAPIIYTHWDWFGTVEPNLAECGAIFIGGSTCDASCNKNWGKDRISAVKRFICEA